LKTDLSAAGRLLPGNLTSRKEGKKHGGEKRTQRKNNPVQIRDIVHNPAQIRNIAHKSGSDQEYCALTKRGICDIHLRICGGVCKSPRHSKLKSHTFINGGLNQI